MRVQEEEHENEASVNIIVVEDYSLIKEVDINPYKILL